MLTDLGVSDVGSIAGDAPDGCWLLNTPLRAAASKADEPKLEPRRHQR